MSQDTFPFDAGSDSADSDTDGESNRRKLLLAGGLVGALVLGAGAYLFLGGSGSSGQDVAFVPVHRSPRVAAAPKAATPVTQLPTAYKEQIGRDPFKALYVVPVAAAAAAPAPPVATAAPTSTSTGTGTTSTGSGSTATAPTTQRYTLKLVSISKPSPEVRFTTWVVDGQQKTVLPAQRFGKYGELVVLAFGKNAQGVVDSAILQVGDDSPISVKVGDSNSVL